MSLRLKLVLAGVLIEIVMAVLLVGNGIRLLETNLQEQANSRIEQVVPVLSAALSGPILQRDFASARQILDLVRSNTAFSYLVLDDHLGKRVAASGWPDGAVLPQRDSRIADLPANRDDMVFHTFKDIDFAGQRLGTLYFGLSTAFLQQARSELLKEELAIATLVLFLSIAFLIFASLYLTRNLGRLSEASQRIAEGNYDVSLMVNSKDEVGKLADNFNLMASTIRQRIDELEASEQALRKSEGEARAMANDVRRLSQVAELTSNVVFISDNTHAIQWVNPGFTRLFGYTLAEAAGKVPAEILSLQGGVASQTEKFIRACDDGFYHRGELLCKTKSGEDRALELELQPLFDENGLKIGSVAVGADITTIQAAANQLAKQRMRLTNIIEGTNAGTWEWDLDTNTLAINERMADLVGYNMAELQPLTLDKVRSFLHLEDRLNARALLDAYLQGNEPYFACELRIIHRSGKLIWALIRGRLTPPNANNNARVMSGICLDITAAKEATVLLAKQAHDLAITNEELRKATQAAEQSSRAKSTFLASMSHELRTPLNAILGFSQLLEFDPMVRSTESIKSKIAFIHNAGRHLLSMVEDVLDLARIEAGGVKLQIDAHELHGVVDECLELTRSLAQKHKIDTRAIECENPIWVQADRTRLRQIVINLISNAIKYNREGGHVDVALSQEGGFAELAIRDTGIGLSEEQLGNLFQPFNRLGAEANTIEGTGIGLVIVKRLAEAMGGSISVSSAVGVGTTFALRLPVAAQQMEQNPNASAPPTAPSASEPREAQKYLVLYIEDNPANVALVEATLEQNPAIHLEIATDGIAGLAAIKRLKPHLVLLDINMPGMDGYEVLQHMRADPSVANTPCLAMTANAMVGDADRAIAAGFDGYITKPFDIDAFQTRVNSLLEGQKRG